MTQRGSDVSGAGASEFQVSEDSYSEDSLFIFILSDFKSSFFTLRL